MKALWIAAALLLFVLPGTVRCAEPDAIVGAWHTEEDKAVVEIFKKGTQYFGRITSLKEPLFPTDPKHPDYTPDHAGQPKADLRNPDANLRGRPIVGMELLAGFQHEGDDVWSAGTIYDPESGNTYRSTLTLAAANELRVRGFVGVSLFGRTTVWKR